MVACSRRSDSGERCEVKGARKNKSEGGERWAAPLSPAPLYFSSLSLLRTALHYLNAWNRLFPWSLTVHHQSLASTLPKTKRLRRRLPDHTTPKRGTKPIRYNMTLHFRDRRGAASLRCRNRAEITVLVCEQNMVWFFLPAQTLSGA